jgi:hypothetical protein
MSLDWLRAEMRHELLPMASDEIVRSVINVAKPGDLQAAKIIVDSIGRRGRLSPFTSDHKRGRDAPLDMTPFCRTVT